MIGNAAERMADEFDLQLFRLAEKAHALSEHGAMGHKKAWKEIASELHSVRPKIRALMHPTRRAETRE